MFDKHTARIRVLVAEDNADLRDVVCLLVSAESDMQCVGTVSTVEEVLPRAMQTEAHVVILDLELQGQSSVSVLRAARDRAAPAIVVFSGHSQPVLIEQTLAAGAADFISKAGDFGMLLSSVRRHGRHVGLR